MNLIKQNNPESCAQPECLLCVELDHIVGYKEHENYNLQHVLHILIYL